jgi:hypothetical protein
MSPTVEAALTQLRTLREAHFTVVLPLMQKGHKYKLDIHAMAVVDRSLALLRGFCDLVAAKNMIAAAPLLRCQLDNGVRFFASTLVQNPHDLANAILNGTPVRKIRDRPGELMRDAYLVEKLTAHVPWAKRLYDQASGYVHFSEQHIINTIGIPDEEGMTQIAITGYDGSVWTDQKYAEAIEAFEYSTRLVLELVEMWAQTCRESQPQEA